MFENTIQWDEFVEIFGSYRSTVKPGVYCRIFEGIHVMTLTTRLSDLTQIDIYLSYEGVDYAVYKSVEDNESENCFWKIRICSQDGEFRRWLKKRGVPSL